MKPLSTLDRYVLSSWVRIFVLTALGFPIVSILINLTDTLNRLLDRGLTMREIAWSYVYSIPENMFLVMPAAVLFATVFTVGAMGRHSELTAVKAGGQSFHRLMVPVFAAATFASLLAFMVGELAPGATAKQLELQKAKAARPTRARYNFVYRGDVGWVYTIRSLDVANRQLKQLLFEREGTGIDYPNLIITADSASWDDSTRGWRMRNGASRVIAGPGKQAMFSFNSLRLRALTQSPADLLAEAKAPDEMRYAELGRYIEALRRSGNDANKLMVEQALEGGHPGDLLHHRAVRRAAGRHHAARRCRRRHRHQPGHDGALPAPHPDHEGGGRRRRGGPHRGGLDPQHRVRRGGGGVAGEGEDIGRIFRP